MALALWNVDDGYDDDDENDYDDVFQWAVISVKTTSIAVLTARAYRWRQSGIKYQTVKTASTMKVSSVHACELKTIVRL